MTEQKSGGRILVDCLLKQGVDRVFCVPGESYLAVLDAMVDSDIDVVVCRQEGGAAMMADAHARMTGRPGVCFVTRAPGATNASAGLHIAQQDSTPLILFIGQAPLDVLEREAFQEVDYRRMLGPLTKWTTQIEHTRRIPEIVSQAFHRAMNGRAGPVAVALPEDVLSETASAPEAGPCQVINSAIGARDMDMLGQLLSEATRPLAVIGGRHWDIGARERLSTFARATSLPVACGFRYQDAFDNDDPNYVGDVGIGINPRLAEALSSCDLLLAVGVRLGEMTTSGYRLVDIPTPRQSLIHVMPGIDELGRVYRPTLGINASADVFAAALESVPKLPGYDGQWLEHLRQSYLHWSTPVNNPGEVQLAGIIAWMRANLPDDAIIANGAGNYSAWLHRFFRYRQPRTQLAPTSGSMGFGLPAAIAAKRACPQRTVVAFVGDGCLQMTIQELATAMQYKAAIIVVVVNNGMYGTIRMHQEKHYPGRVMATSIVNPDFVALAKSYGMHGESITNTAEFPAAFERATATGLPAMIDVRLDPDAISPTLRLGQNGLEPLDPTEAQ